MIKSMFCAAELQDEFDNLFHCIFQAVGVLASGCGEVGLTAAAALDKACSLAYSLSGTLALGHQIITQRNGEGRLAISQSAYDYEQLLRVLGAELESYVLGILCIDEVNAADYCSALDGAGLLDEALLDILSVLGTELIDLAFQGGIVIDSLLYCCCQVWCTAQ